MLTHRPRPAGGLLAGLWPVDSDLGLGSGGGTINFSNGDATVTGDGDVDAGRSIFAAASADLHAGDPVVGNTSGSYCNTRLMVSGTSGDHLLVVTIGKVRYLALSGPRRRPERLSQM
jgi:hypothetical protein